MKRLVLLAVLLVFVGSACAADITTGLVGWWKMDGQTDPGNAKLVKDYSGFGNDGYMGSNDQWLPGGGGIDFDGGSWGLSGVVFGAFEAELIADLNLTTQATVSFWATWDKAELTGRNDIFDGRNSSLSGDNRLLSMEFASELRHIYNHQGGSHLPAYEACNDQHANFVFTKNGVGKTWGDMIRITTTVNFDTGDYKMYIDDKLYLSLTGQTGSYVGMDRFNIGRSLYAEMQGKLSDFRIYNRELSADDVATLVPEPATIALLGLGALTLIKRKRS